MVDWLDLYEGFYLGVDRLKVAQEDVGTAFGGREEDGKSAHWLLGDRVFSYYLDAFELFEAIVVGSADEDGSDVDLPTVAVVAQEDVAVGVVVALSCNDDALGSLGLGIERPCSVGAGLLEGSLDDHIDWLAEVL
jgi:hypothetical protein